MMRPTVWESQKGGMSTSNISSKIIIVANIKTTKLMEYKRFIVVNIRWTSVSEGI